MYKLHYLMMMSKMMKCIIIIIIINEYYLGAVKSQELLEHLTRLT